MSTPTLGVLKGATVTFTGTSVTVLFRDRDRHSTQFKQLVSFQLKRPVQFIFQNGKETTIEWWVDGINYNPHGPAKIVEGANDYQETHHLKDGSLGRRKGPAFVHHKFGVEYFERWTEGQSVLHRNGGPALIEIEYGNPPTDTWGNFSKDLDFKKVSLKGDLPGSVIKRREQTWSHRGKCTNQDGWAKKIDFTVFEHFEPVQSTNLIRTSYVTQRELRWYDEREKLHRLDGPAVLKFRNLREIEKNGEDAVRWQCESWSGEWYVRGNEIPSYDLFQWAKKNHIVLNNEPCYDRSAFATPDGELCFITDMVKEHTT